MAINKPKYTENEIWANNPPDPSVDVMEPHDGDPIGGTDAKKALGWQYGEKPPYNFVNWNNQHKDEMLVHLNQTGIVDWDADTEYQLHAFINYPPFDPANPGIERKIYVKIDDTGATGTPDANTDWDVDIDLTSRNIVVQSTGPADGSKITMTGIDGKLHQSLMSIGVLTYRGGVDIEQTAPLHNDPADPLNPQIFEEIESGDFWTISNDPSGNYDSTFDPLTGDGHLGEGLIVKVNKPDPLLPITQADVEWYRIGSGLNETYLIRDGHLPMQDLSGSGGGNGRLFLAHTDQDSVDSGDLESTSRKYVQDKFIWKTGGAQGVMSGDLNVNADILLSGQLDFTSPAIITSTGTIDIQGTDLTYNADKILTNKYALMDSSYDMEANPANYDDLNLTSKGYVDDKIDTLITWPEEQNEDATVQDQTDFSITNSNTAQFDPAKINVFVEGILLRRGSGYGYTVQPDGGAYKVVLENGVDLGSWVFIQHT